jgi:hypothetical protein
MRCAGLFGENISTSTAIRYVTYRTHEIDWIVARATKGYPEIRSVSYRTDRTCDGLYLQRRRSWVTLHGLSIR